MDISEYITNKKEIQNKLITFLDDNDSDYADKLKELIQYLGDNKIQEDENEFRAFLYLLLFIHCNHHRNPNFLKKIDSIIINYQNEIKHYFPNDEMYSFFKKDKRILLCLLENQILILNQQIANDLLSDKEFFYSYYFYPEIKKLIDENKSQKIKDELLSDENIFSNFNEKRQIGENDSYICQLIREDSVKEFIIYTNKTNFPLKSKIKSSIFETNFYLAKNNPTLIEYSAFFGSIQIFMYLIQNGVEMSSSLWDYAIHSNSAELIRYLEDSHVKPLKDSYEQCIMTAVKCYHNDIVNYFISNYMQDKSETLSMASIMCHNYAYLPNEFHPSHYCQLCCNDYYFIVKKLIEQKKIKINELFNHNSNPKYVSSLLFDAIFSDKYKIVELLLEQKGINLDFDVAMYSNNNSEITQNALSLSVCNNNLQMVKLILSRRKPDINYKSIFRAQSANGFLEYKESAPIIFAITNLNIEIIKIFLAYPEFDVNIGNKHYLSTNAMENYFISLSLPLHEAINLGYSNIVELLLQRKDIDINAKSISTIDNNRTEMTPLYMAIKNKNIEIVKLLLSHSNINVNKKSTSKNNENQYNETPLHLAIRENNLAITEMLLNHPSIEVNKKSIVSKASGSTTYIIYETVLHLAVKNKNKEVIQFLLKNHHIKINKKIMTETIKSIFNRPEKTKDTTLNIALYDGDMEIISLLLNSKNIDINAKGTSLIDATKYEWNPLSISLLKKQNDITKLLLVHDDINVNTDFKISDEKSIISKSPLYMAIENDCEEIIRLLLSHPEININYVSLHYILSKMEVINLPLLHFAFSKGNEKVIKLLLSQPNIEINTKTISRISNTNEIIIEEFSTLIFAIVFGNVELFKMLLLNPSIDIFMISHLQKIKEGSANFEEKSIIKTIILNGKSDFLEILLDYLDNNNLYCYELKNYIGLTDDIQINYLITSYLESNNEKADQKMPIKI